MTEWYQPEHVSMFQNDEEQKSRGAISCVVLPVVKSNGVDFFEIHCAPS